MSNVIPFLCSPDAVYDLSENDLAMEMVKDTPLGDAVKCIRAGDPIDVSTFVHLHNAGVNFVLLEKAYLR